MDVSVLILYATDHAIDEGPSAVTILLRGFMDTRARAQGTVRNMRFSRVNIKLDKTDLSLVIVD